MSDFTVEFSEPVKGFTNASVQATGPGPVFPVVTGSGTTYNVAVSGMTGNGWVTVTVPANVASDLSNNPNIGPVSTSVDFVWAKHFDFGPRYSPVATGYTAVTASTRYSVPLGFGWFSGIIFEQDSYRGSPLDRDSNSTSDGTFVVNVPNGTYRVEMHLGAIGYYGRDQMGVFLEGTQVDTVSTTSYQVVPRTYTLLVDDGQLTVRLQDQGGADRWAEIEALTATAVLPDVVRPTATITKASGQDSPTSNSTINFTVEFREPVKGFTNASVQATGPGDLVATVTGSGTTYNVAVSGMTGNGPVTVTVPPNVASDLSNNPNVGQVSASVDFVWAKHFDFGARYSPVATGYTAIPASTRYNQALGYGWQSGIIYEQDSYRGSVLDRDSNSTSDGTFVVDVPNGTYQVEMHLGAVGYYGRDQMGVFLEGTQVDTVSTTSYQVVPRSYTPLVTDGQLTVRLQDQGGADRWAEIQSLTVTAVSPDEDSPTATITKASGQDSPTNNSTINFTVEFSEPVKGFTNASVQATGPGPVVPVVTGSGTTYNVAISGMTGNGPVTVTVPANAARDLSNNPNIGPVSASVDFVWAKRYDFGTWYSPVATGYTAVTASTRYSAPLGFGWFSGIVYEQDSYRGLALDRDSNSTSDGTFVVDVPNGTYQVEMHLGAVGYYGRDQMGVFLEGTRVDTVSTAAYQVVTKTYTLPVTDGQLTVKLQDLGGPDRWVEIQALTVTRVGSPLIIQVNAAELGIGPMYDGDSLTDASLRPIVTEAISRWARAGVSAEVLAAMANASLVIADLPRNYLGEAIGNTVYLSRDAAQRGWFIDLTPSRDEEFASLGGRRGACAVDPRALDRVDLLTVVEHELGHLAGLDDLDPFATDLMSGSLSAGTRRLPGKSQVDAILGQQRLDDWL